MQCIIPTWEVPTKIKALTTVRNAGGVSQAPFASLNVALHVGDDEANVRQNRAWLMQQFNLPNQPSYLHQTHSVDVVELPCIDTKLLSADAAYTNQVQQVCAIMTADCLPVLLCSDDGSEVAAAHAGWRGLCDGIIENTCKKFTTPKSNLKAWLGPAISQRAFQVGIEVKQQFIQHDPQAEQAFIPDPNNQDKYFADLYLLARQRLLNIGLLAENIYSDDFCTYTDEERFFSYRRAATTGRLVSLIWIDK